MRTLFTLAAACALCAAAWAVDVVVERATAAPGAGVAPARDAPLELGWDNGTRRSGVAWFTGAGVWVGNDFDIATISTYRGVEKIRFYSRSDWPNSQWDGCRIGIYSFTSVPGSLLWGPRFVIGSGSGNTWCDFSVGWTLPAGPDAFLAAVEQYYNWPNCDAFTVDTNTNFLRHSWQYYGGNWSLLSPGVELYRNLMLRVVVDNETVAVSPSSLGRVKALY
ncbi:MAG TPA: hypothetical protein VMW93_04590 [bacterium]|nr:hypothetical protein [bacterium]